MVPAAASISVMVKKGEDEYFMCLLDAKGEPFAQWGWTGKGWKDFAWRILTQLAQFERTTNLAEPLKMIACEMHPDAFTKALDFDRFKDHVSYSYVIIKENIDDLTITIKTRRLVDVGVHGS